MPPYGYRKGEPAYKTEGLPNDYNPSLSHIFDIGDDLKEQYRLCKLQTISANGAKIEIKPVDKPDVVLDNGSSIELSDPRVMENGNEETWKVDEWITAKFHKPRGGHAELVEWKRGFKMSPKDNF